MLLLLALLVDITNTIFTVLEFATEYYGGDMSMGRFLFYRLLQPAPYLLMIAIARLLLRRPTAASAGALFVCLFVAAATWSQSSLGYVYEERTRHFVLKLVLLPAVCVLVTVFQSVSQRRRHGMPVTALLPVGIAEAIAAICLQMTIVLAVRPAPEPGYHWETKAFPWLDFSSSEFPGAGREVFGNIDSGAVVLFLFLVACALLRLRRRCSAQATS